MTLNNSSRIILRISGSKTCWSSSVHRVICCRVFMMSSLISLSPYVLFNEASPTRKQDYWTTHSHHSLLQGQHPCVQRRFQKLILLRQKALQRPPPRKCFLQNVPAIISGDSEPVKIGIYTVIRMSQIR